jgi:maltoporin
LLASLAFAQNDSPRAPLKPAAPASAVAPTAASDGTASELFHGRFEFGSYGRINVGSDLRGALGTSANVVAHGPRLLQDSYAELELRREDDWGAIHSRVVATLGFFPPFFQFSGNAAQQIGLRNLYAEAALTDSVSVWAGSRMYRGDDIYLLDFWPLDNLNTVGGGARFVSGGTSFQLHAGMQRLDQPYQYQAVVADNPLGYGGVPVSLLNRPRIVESAKVTQEFKGEQLGARFSLYGEAHEIGAGKYRDTATGDERALPSDWGALVGGQASVYLPGNRFAHLWVRQAMGLATYDELSVPTTFANDHTTQGAHSTRLAFAGGWGTGIFGLLAGAYVDLVRDAGVSQQTAQKYDEGALTLRGQYQPLKYAGFAAEASVQRRVYGLVDPVTGSLRQGNVAQFAVMPYLSPLGPGLFSRPQLRLVYALSLRDAGARSFYPQGDPASQRGVAHYLGLSVEWWFNSTTYGR